MKKIFQILGLIGLTCFSFFMTEKTATVVSDMDEIMIEIKANYKNYKSNSVDAIIDNNTIIPGIRAKDVNIKKSYKNSVNCSKNNSKTLSRLKNIFEYLNEYSREEILDVIENLSEEDKKIFTLRYGTDLDNPNSSEWSNNYNSIFYRRVIPRMKRELEKKRNEKMKVLKK